MWDKGVITNSSWPTWGGKCQPVPAQATLAPGSYWSYGSYCSYCLQVFISQHLFWLVGTWAPEMARVSTFLARCFKNTLYLKTQTCLTFHSLYPHEQATPLLTDAKSNKLHLDPLKPCDLCTFFHAVPCLEYPPPPHMQVGVSSFVMWILWNLACLFHLAPTPLSGSSAFLVASAMRLIFSWYIRAGACLVSHL